MLTNFNGTAINYDAIGNPLNWRNSTSLTWKARQLEGQTLSNDDWISYIYNSSGIRTRKEFFRDVESCFKTYDYVLDGTKILSETVRDELTDESYTLYYLYDESRIVGFIYNNSYYYFQKNIHGDIIRIVNTNGVVVVEYTYDAWGNILSVTGSLADTIGHYNPFRYRSYYYDSETGFYYLQSRYYDPTVGRFLNADGIIGANGGIVGYNLFAYCNNNPVVFSDESGFALRSNTEIINDGGSSKVNSSESQTSQYSSDETCDNVPPMRLKDDILSVPNITKNIARTANLEGTLGPYNQLREMTKGIPELEVHHLIEFRFCSAGGELARYNRYNAPAVIVSKANHRALTNAFRTKFPYGKTDYSSMESSSILSFFKNEYSNGGKPEWVDYICSYYD